MSDRKITAPGPGWRMPGKLQSKNIRDATPNLLGAMGAEIERVSKPDFGTPGVHTQNGFQQPHEAPGPGLSWVVLVDAIPSGTYSQPAIARAKMLVADNSISEGALREGSEEVFVYNYASGFSASSGEWVLVAPFNGVLIALSSGGGGTGSDIVQFQITSFCYGFDGAGLDCPCYEAEVIRVQCGSSIVAGETISVYDPDNCWFNMPADLLFGRKGTAMLCSVGDDFGGHVNCTLLPGNLLDGCFWNVLSLCCSEEEYAI